MSVERRLFCADLYEVLFIFSKNTLLSNVVHHIWVTNTNACISLSLSSWPPHRYKHLVCIVCVASAFFFFFWPCPQHTEVPRSGAELLPQQGPKSQQWQCWILNPLSHQGTPCIYFLNFILFYFILRPYLWHMETPRLGVDLELQLRPMPRPWQTSRSLICYLCCSLQQCHILNPLNEAWDRTGILKETMSSS